MNLLLVDDEEYVIESIKKNVDWELLNIGQIYTASSMQQAQTVMGLMPIHVIVSDIVMPKGSGFDFMEWVRKEAYEVQAIFLTSYAEFDFARLFRQTFQHHQFSRIVDPKRQCVLTQSRTCNHELFLSCYSLSSSRPFCRRIVFLSVFPVSIAGKQTKIRADNTA